MNESVISFEIVRCKCDCALIRTSHGRRYGFIRVVVMKRINQSADGNTRVKHPFFTLIRKINSPQ